MVLMSQPKSFCNSGAGVTHLIHTINSDVFKNLVLFRFCSAWHLYKLHSWYSHKMDFVGRYLIALNTPLISRSESEADLSPGAGQS